MDIVLQMPGVQGQFRHAAMLAVLRKSIGGRDEVRRVRLSIAFSIPSVPSVCSVPQDLHPSSWNMVELQQDRT